MCAKYYPAFKAGAASTLIRTAADKSFFLDLCAGHENSVFILSNQIEMIQKTDTNAMVETLLKHSKKGQAALHCGCG